MCGIGGILRVHPPGAVPPLEAAIPEAWLDIIDDAVKHRGPDGKGRFRDRVVRPDGSTVDVALVHRRLSIIDHRDGWQPMVQGGTALLSREDEPYREMSTHMCPRCSMLASRAPTVRERVSGSSSEIAHQTHSLTVGARQSADLLAVVFNGCIYNHRELRTELQAAGHVFTTDHSDTEVLLHGWREWHAKLKQHLDGMFAFGLWDRAAARIALFRDRFGEKPLYVLAPQSAGLWAFASTAVGVQSAGTEIADELPRSISAALNQESTRRWIAFGYHDASTPFEATQQLPPGLVVGAPTTKWEAIESAGDREFRKGRPSQVRRFMPHLESRAALVDRFDRLIEEAVVSRLESDAPLGCFLSGGIDSSIVARAASRRTQNLRTICVRMPDRRYDESARAAEVARIIGSDHITVECDPHPAADLVLLIRTLGLPFGDSSLLPTFWASCAAAQHVKVALSGDGGDELFLGYERYGPAEWIGLLEILVKHIPFHIPVPAFISGADPKARVAKFARLCDAAAHHGYEDLLAIFPASLHRHLFNLRVVRPDATPMSRVQAQEYDLRRHLPGDMLRKVDTASMMMALEVRSPLLSQSIADAALALPPHLLRLGGQRKGLLRAVARKYFPSEIVDRPKQGFAIPIGDWFRSDYGGMKQLLLDHLNSAEPWGSPSLGIDLNMKFVRQMLDEHMNHKRDHSQRLYMLLVLSIWAKGLAV